MVASFQEAVHLGRFFGYVYQWVYDLVMELLRIAKLPIEAAKFLGHQMLGGGWADLPALPQGPYEAPKRVSANIQFLRTPDIPDNIEMGRE